MLMRMADDYDCRDIDQPSINAPTNVPRVAAQNRAKSVRPRYVHQLSMRIGISQAWQVATQRAVPEVHCADLPILHYYAVFSSFVIVSACFCSFLLVGRLHRAKTVPSSVLFRSPLGVSG